MALAAGTKLGPYEVLAPLGAGGIGEVYRGRDTRLGREVAIKVLSARLSTSEDARQRFEREARAISKLSHPHICALYDVAREGDLECLVMELLDGETLADRLSKGPLPLDEVLRLGAQIASALEAAHGNGIVHRDLKPGNVMLTRSGTKLLDFGLAKALAPDASPEDPSSSPTLTATADLTREGAMLGTPAYMAPEQLEGKKASTASDIFALGLVLFEMLTGRRAFSGPSPASLISAILTSDPPGISSLRPDCPPALDDLIRICLSKDPAKRWRSARDVELQLDTIARRPSTGAAVAEGKRGYGRWVPWVIAAVATVVAAAALVIESRPHRGASAAMLRFSELPPPGGSFVYSFEAPFLTLSPDGSRIAYIATAPEGGPALWTRALDASEPRMLPGTEGVSSTFWAPDSRSLAFFTWRGKLKRIQLGEGTPVPICDVKSATAFSGTWGAEGDILFAGPQGEAIYRVSAAGGPSAALMKPDAARHESRYQFPWFLPDGRSFFFLAQSEDGSRRLMSVEPGQQPRSVMAAASNVQFVDPGYLVFVREGALLGQRFDWRSGRLEGTPFSIVEHVRYFLSTGCGAFTTSRTGTIAYQPQDDVIQPTRFDRTGRRLGSVGTAGKYLNLSVSPESTRALLSRARPDIGTFDIWEIDLARGVETRITSSDETDVDPIWLPGGKSFVYSAVHGAPPHLFRRDLASGIDEKLATGKGGFQMATDVSPDGHTLLFGERKDRAIGSWRIALAGGAEPAPIGHLGVQSTLMRFSPDGRFIAYLSSESGSQDVYVSPFPGPGERTRVSTTGATLLRWNRSRGEILYLSSDRRLMSVAIRTEPTLQVGTPTPLFSLAGTHAWQDFDVTANGQQILALVPESLADEQPLSVIVGWPASIPQ
jgi:eukaryotic-like serine/threonine-protein kinase